MATYLVTWQIDIDAVDAYDAALKARDIQRDSNSTATFFDVEPHDTGEVFSIELGED